MTSSLDLKQDIRRVIKGVFGNDSPPSSVCTEEKFARVRSLVSFPQLDDRFNDAAKEILKQELGGVEIYSNWNEDFDGNAWVIAGYVEFIGVVFCLLICCFYPVATVRAGAAYSIIGGLNKQWQLALNSQEEIELVNSTLTALEVPINSLLSDYGYLYLPPEADTLQQKIRADFFCHYPAWDYLFYIGGPIQAGWCNFPDWMGLG
jgi:hypothetical protein